MTSHDQSAAAAATAGVNARLAALDEYAHCLAEQIAALARHDMETVARLAERRDALQRTVDSLPPLTAQDARADPQGMARLHRVLGQCTAHHDTLQQALGGARRAGLGALRQQRERRGGVVAYLRNGRGSARRIDRRF